MNQHFKKLYLENQICFPLYAASRLTTKVYGPYLKELDLTYPQYLVMMVLWKEDHQTVNRIGERLLLESNTLTPLLKRLEQKGLLSRKRSSLDERSVVVSLYPKGEILKEKAVSIPDKILGDISGSTMTAEEIRIFQHTLLKLVDALNAKIPNDTKQDNI
ncbi:MarR family winged helix-turn-helix transcriptional regulator [Anditalea andensis]|uniref:MarR family transcriptional regulator n=1 Tax=Anditalea andensis TaxID=1048983 RepID=A0A074L1M3_9BACT|nr:MarR family transcriptional regulator [Anditalea andensis]KEO73758.1 MarR family transcriptional regulator [Anditalea andensis]